MIFSGGSPDTAGQKPIFRIAASKNLSYWAVPETPPEEVEAPPTEIPEDDETSPTPPAAPPPPPPPPPVRPTASLSLSLRSRVVSASSTGAPTTTQDRIVQTITYNTAVTDYSIQLSANVPINDITLALDNSALGTISGTTLTWVANGSTVLKATYQSEVLASAAVTFATTTGSSLTQFVGFAEGSLAKHCDDNITSRIQNATTAMLPVFSIQNPGDAVYVRNTASWCYDLRQKMTCISPWNTTGGVTRAGTLITPRHIIFAAHFEIAEGATIRFVTANNVVVTRTMTKKLRHPDYVPYLPDLTVGVLSSDVPNTITPCKVLPTNYADYLPTGPKYIGTLQLDQEEKASIADLDYINENPSVVCRWSADANKVILTDSKIVGDSGNPVFLIINDELVLLTVFTGGGPGSGTFITGKLASVNQMITDVDTLAGISTGYSLTTVDLSGFTDFS